jgi:transposase-like protein
VHPSQINVWRNQLKENMASVFSKPDNKELKEKDAAIEQLQKIVGRMTVEHDWLKKKLNL